MREILFRGRREDGKGWVKGDLRQYNYGGRAINSWNAPLAEFDIDPETVGQYTGLVDRNGKRIFEGDIVCMRTGKAHVVIYSNGGFRLEGTAIPFSRVYLFEIIGNIHDNPELLEVENHADP